MSFLLYTILESFLKSLHQYCYINLGILMPIIERRDMVLKTIYSTLWKPLSPVLSPGRNLEVLQFNLLPVNMLPTLPFHHRIHKTPFPFPSKPSSDNKRKHQNHTKQRLGRIART